MEIADEHAVSHLRRGWFVGSDLFKAQLLEKIDGALGEHHSGQKAVVVVPIRNRRTGAVELN